MISLDFDWQTNEFMLYCRTTQLREKSITAYEQSLKLFQRWCMDEMGIFTVDKVTENVIRRYISELQERGKYTFYRIDKQKKTNYPERRRDYRKPISTATINNYNAVMENFFGILKSELLYLQDFESMEHFKNELVDYLDYYNNRRCKEKLMGLPPALHRQQALSVA